MSYNQGRAIHKDADSTVAHDTTLASTNGVNSMSSRLGHVDVCQHERTLHNMQGSLELMRELVTCKICDRMLYEPYALSCGHTYCYSCLSQWLVSNHKKTCPDCRAIIRQQPTPSYVIKELVLVIVGRNELLPDGETFEDHSKFAREEAEIVAKDKANTDPINGGLFKGCFSSGRHAFMPIHDPGDGVDRCPNCHWELEDGFCNQCELSVDEDDIFDEMPDEEDFTDDELDHDVDLSDAEAVFGTEDYVDGYSQFRRERRRMHEERAATRLGPNATALERQQQAESQAILRDFHEGERTRAVHRRPRRAERGTAGGRREPIELGSDDSSVGSEDEDDPEMASFIVNDDGTSSADEGEPEVTHTAPRRRLIRGRAAPVVLSDDEEADNGTSSATAQESVQISDDDDDEEPVTRGSQRNKRAPVAVSTRSTYVISSDDEHDDEGNDSGTADRYGGFSPPTWDGSAGASPPTDLPGIEGVGGIYPESDSDDEIETEVHHFLDEEEDEEPSDEESEDEEGWGTRARTRHHGESRRKNADAPTHPFQLDNTLARINRSLDSGFHPGIAEDGGSASSSRSSTNGGVDVQSATTEVSRETARSAHLARAVRGR